MMLAAPHDYYAPGAPQGHFAVDRRFGAILGLSMLLHATLFVVGSWQKQVGPVELPSLVASIRLIPLAESAPVVEAAHAPAAVPRKTRPDTTRPAQRSVLPVESLARPATVLAPVPLAAAAAEPASSGAPSPVAAVDAVRPAPPVAPQRPQSDVLEGYRQRLGELFAGQQEYPRVAAMRGWEGEVRLRLKVARKGNLVAVQLDRSSGFAVLDQHALAMLERLAGLPPLPEALEANEIQVVVPINYRLGKTT